jgi:Sec-independent protein translocase protein TatA
MFGIGPTELAFFLVIVLLAVGPDRLPTFMRTVGRGVRQVRNASREFKDAIGLDELMREGDPFRTPPVRPPRARPVPVEQAQEKAEPETQTVPPPVPEAAKATSAAPTRDSSSSSSTETKPASDPEPPVEGKQV